MMARHVSLIALRHAVSSRDFWCTILPRKTLMLPCVIGVPDRENVYETGSPIQIRIRYLLRLFKITHVTHCLVRCTQPPQTHRVTSGLGTFAPMPMPDEDLIALGSLPWLP